MKFTIHQKTLERALFHAIGIIEKNVAASIKGHVLLSAKAGRGIMIKTTNMDIVFETNIPCDVEESGSYCVPSHLLYDITKKMSSKCDITVQKLDSDRDDDTINIFSDRASFKINYISADKFPVLNTGDDFVVKTSIGVAQFKEALNIAKVAILNDPTRFSMHGIHIHRDSDDSVKKLYFVSTDWFRVARSSIDLTDDMRDFPPVIVSRKTVTELLKLLDSATSDTFELMVSENKIAANIDCGDTKTSFCSRLVSGTFPNYISVINTQHNKRLVIDNEQFIKSIDRVSTVISDQVNAVKFDISSSKVVISGADRELGRAQEELDAQFDSEPMTINFNGRFIIELLKNISTKKSIILMSQGDMAVKILPDAQRDVGCEFVLMPIEITKA